MLKQILGGALVENLEAEVDVEVPLVSIGSEILSPSAKKARPLSKKP